MNNNARFTALRQKIGGVREVTGFEYTFGRTKEAGWHITPPNKNIRRILSEVEFALKMDEAEGGIHAGPIARSLDILEAAIRDEGVLTNTACHKAEEALLPLKEAAKAYGLILCAHAHIDMNWMWGWNETVAAALATFTTMLELMDEYPDFTYSQSQTSVYRLVEEYDPAMMERIKARIKEGRWEVTASAWVETDKNMPSGESLLNTVKYTREYLERVWDVDPASLNVDFSPDTFGHSRHIPEIDTYAGVKYYYHCRGLAGDNILYRFKAPSGAEVLMAREAYWYNSAITPHIGIGLPALCPRMGGLKTGLIVYGVGNHGGGPTRRDIERAYEMMEWPIFPTLKFGTFHEFFALADRPEIREKLPVVDRELNFLFDGCYTTQTRIKRGNHMAEAKLIEAQLFSAAAEKLGRPYRADAFAKAWEDTLFTHFHDILTGSCVQDSREYAMALYQKALAHAETEENLALKHLAAAIDTSMIDLSDEEAIIRDSQSEGAGVGYGIPAFAGVPNPERGAGLTRVFHLFSSSQKEREELCMITVWDWVGDIRRLTVTDTDGNPVEFALIDGEAQHYWSHMYIRLLVRAKLSAFGFTTVVVREKEADTLPFYYHPTHGSLTVPVNACVLENEYLRAEFSPADMRLLSLIDKTDGSEKVKRDEFFGLVQIDADLAGNSAWAIGTHHAVKPLCDVSGLSGFGFGSLRNGYRWDAKALNSSVHAEVSLDKGARMLRFELSVEWNEIAGRFAPMLAFRAPLGYRSGGCLCDVPMGTAVRAEAANDIPALTYAAALNPASSPLFLMTDSKYGYRYFENALLCMLIHTAHNPDPDPERGHHTITLAVGISDNRPDAMADLSEAFSHPIRYVPMNPHRGTLPPTCSLMEADTGTARITSVTVEDGRTHIRLAELCGSDTEVCLKPGPITKARVINLIGEEIGCCTAINGEVRLTVPAYSIVTVEVE